MTRIDFSKRTSKSPIRLMFFSSSLGTGGAERFVANALNGLSSDDYTLFAVFFRSGGVYKIPDNVSVKVLYEYNFLNFLKGYYKYIHWIEAVKPDIILSSWTIPNIFTALALIRSKHKPLWIARLANNPDFRERGLVRLLAKYSYHKANHCIAVSAELADKFTNRYHILEKKISSISNAVDPDKLHYQSGLPVTFPNQFSNTFSQGKPVIISVGRLDRQKRFDLLLEAFSHVIKKFPSKLVILGDGSQRKNLEFTVSKLGLKHSVIMPGFEKNPYAWIDKSNVFALSSDYEGMSNALLEALALGKPAVVTNCSFGNSELVIDHFTGFLVPWRNPEAMAEKIICILNNHSLAKQMSENAKTYIQKNFSFITHIDKLNNLFAKIMQQRHLEK